MSEDIEFPKGPDVYWEKWQDPYETNEIENIDNEEMYEDFSSDLIEHEGVRQVKGTKCLMTPMGVIPITEHNLPSRLFKFWTGHSNFNISPDFVPVIENTPGVETVNIWTRYRFRLGIGKLFDDKFVMYQVKENMLRHLETRNATQKVQ